MRKEITKINASTVIKVTRYENGKVESKTSYVNGVKHGLEEWWYRGGSKWREINWKNNKKHGLEIEQHEDGSKGYEISWREGKQHGMDTWWYRNGQKRWGIYHLPNKKYAEIEWSEEGKVWKAALSTRSSATNPAVKSKKITSTHG